MPKHNTTIILLIEVALVLVQVIDIILHAATNQTEPLRITANAAILVWLAFIAFGDFKQGVRLLSVGFMAVYLALNIIFLAVNGLTNAAQGGGLRVTLLVLIGLTVILAALLSYFWQRREDHG